MKKYNIAKMNMYQAVENFLDKSTSIVAGSVALQDTIVDYKKMLEETRSISALENTTLSGITLTKKEKKRKLTSLFAEKASVIGAYAAKKGDLDLREKMDYTASQLYIMVDKVLVDHCTQIRNAMESQMASLPDFGIFPATLVELDQALADYKPVQTARKNAGSVQKMQRTTLGLQFDKMDDMLENIVDKLVAGFRESQPDFYKTYRNNRRIIDPRSVATSLAGKVMDGKTKLPVQGVMVTVQKDELLFSMETGLDGEYKLKIPVPGLYSVTYSHPDYPSSFTAIVEILLGKRKRKSIVLEKK